MLGKPSRHPPARASWRRRTAAWAIDALLAFTPLCVGFVVAFRRRGINDYGVVDLGELPGAAKHAASALADAVAVLAECGRSPGCRIAGIDRVTECTGRRVGLARALLRVALVRSATPIMRPLLLPRKHRRQAFQSAHGVSLEDARAFALKLRVAELQHPGDQDAIDRAQAALYAGHPAEFARLPETVDPLEGRREQVVNLAIGFTVSRLLHRVREHLTGRTISLAR